MINAWANLVLAKIIIMRRDENLMFITGSGRKDEYQSD